MFYPGNVPVILRSLYNLDLYNGKSCFVAFCCLTFLDDGHSQQYVRQLILYSYIYKKVYYFKQVPLLLEVLENFCPYGELFICSASGVDTGVSALKYEKTSKYSNQPHKN